MTDLPERLEIDVAVIGAGPAGTTAAALLHRAGLNTHVFERARFPRFVIGESLLPRCMELLQGAGLLSACQSQGYMRKHGATFLRGERRCDFDFAERFGEGWSYTWQVPRAHFDEVLTDAAQSMGVPVHFEHEVLDVSVGAEPRLQVSDGAGASCEVRCRFVVDASGYQRVLPAKLQLDAPSPLPRRKAIFAHFTGDRRPAGREAGKIWIVTVDRDTWLWVIPFSNGRTSVGVVSLPELFERFGDDAEGALRAAIDLSAPLRRRLVDAEVERPAEAIVGYSIGVKQLHGEGYCLVGNSTEFLDPVFSSGVTLALESATRAAGVVSRQLGGEAVDWEREYAQPMLAGIDVFRTYIDAWYDGTLPNVFFSSRRDETLERMLCAVLAGDVWDLDNPLVREPRRKVAQLARLALQRDDNSYDVVIAGGGLAGLTLALQLRRELPELMVALVEAQRRPLPDACHKVGESSVELGSCYLERLGLRDYLHERHLVKNGLRFFPGGGAARDIADRTEIGPSATPLVTSYQIDRGRLENDLRAMVEDAGVALLEGAFVEQLELGDGDEPHRVRLAGDDVPSELEARWVVDATGRVAMLRNRLKLTRGAAHRASSGWFRVPEKIDIADMVPQQRREWHEHDPQQRRWLSTVHLMGEGYWVWLIPLPTGYTSVGIVVHDDVHGAEAVSTLEASMAFLERHEPVLFGRLANVEVADFLALPTYSYAASRFWSRERWSIVGEAGAFGDPLYSPGTDFIAYANTFTTEAIKSFVSGGDLEARVRQLNTFYRSLYQGAAQVVLWAAPVYGHPSAMAAKIYWDNFAYWSFSCQYFMRRIYELHGDDHAPFTEVGARFVELNGYVQKLLSQWARLRPEDPTARYIDIPGFPSLVVEVHQALLEERGPGETLTFMRERVAQAEQIAVELLLRVVQQLGPELGEQLVEAIDVASWNLHMPAERLAIEALGGLERRKRLGPVGRDVDRCLGRVSAHPRAAAARQLLQ